MEWKLSNEQREKYLKDLFSRLNIDCDKPGFCDSPAFLRAEHSNPRIMDSYAEFVETRAYNREYLACAAQKIRLVSETIRRAVEADGRLGACVDASFIIGRMLDKLGIWNYVAKATLSITYPARTNLPNTYFWAIDNRKFDAPHAIVIAPPFGVIDVTLKYQAYGDRRGDFLPHAVIAESFSLPEWSAEDLACDDLRTDLQTHRIKFIDYLREKDPHMLEVMKALPPRQLTVEGILLKYVVVAVSGSVEQLENIAGYKPGGQTALELFQSQVFPHLESL